MRGGAEEPPEVPALLAVGECGDRGYSLCDPFLSQCPFDQCADVTQIRIAARSLILNRRE
jgi:hypothetical protein